MDLNKLFQIAIEKKASDIHLVAGCPPAIRVNGDLFKIDDEVLNSDELEKSFDLIAKMSDYQIKKFHEQKEIDISVSIQGTRFRVNLHYQEGKVGITARLIPGEIPKPDEIDFDEIMYSFTHFKDGLILVTGPTGCGKSTTLAAMIDIINQERMSHVITIEDPIEFLFKEKQSIIEQRELGVDTDSFSKALKYALRQDPNIIMVGEMRDAETITAALTAAETGHLVLSTLHTTTAAETIERIVNAFDDRNQKEIVISLAASLRVVIAQDLLPRVGGGRVVAREILINTRAIANLILTGKYNQINSVIQTSKKEGMISMNKYIENLYNRGLITKEVANNRMRDLETQISYF